MKIANILRCTLWALSQHVEIYDKLRICLNKNQASIMPAARPLSSILILPIGWQLCDRIKLSDCCRSKYQYVQGENHCALSQHAKHCIMTFSLRFSEHPYCVRL